MTKERAKAEELIYKVMDALDTTLKNLNLWMIKNF